MSWQWPKGELVGKVKSKKNALLSAKSERKKLRLRKKGSLNFEIKFLLPKNQFYELLYTSKCWKLNKKAINSVGIEI